MTRINVRLAWAAAIGTMWLSGCSTPAIRIRDNPQVFAQLAPEQQALVQAGKVATGFTMDAVRLALGDPDRVTLRTDANGQTQIWHYVDYTYVEPYFVYGPGWGGGWGGGGGWRGGGGYRGGGPGPGAWFWETHDFAVPYEPYRIEFRNGKVISISQQKQS